MPEYDLFSFFEEQRKRPSQAEMRQAVLAFLAKGAPSCAAMAVPLKRKHLTVTAAGCWLKRSAKKPVQKTVAVELCTAREALFGRCINPDELQGKINVLQAEKEKLEKMIELTEPHLADSDELFSDFRHWDYRNSSNKHYHAVCRKLSSLENALHNGSKLELVKAQCAADYLYLAIPDGAVSPDEVPPDWGVLVIDENCNITELKAPEKQDVDETCRQFLVQNITAKAWEGVLLASGIRPSGGCMLLSKTPRRRKTVRIVK